MNANVRTISAPAGRQLRVRDAGQPDGIPLLVHTGTPGSALLHDAWIKDAGTRGIRVISYDRPGYGGSTPQPGRTVASVAEDVEAIATALGLKRLVSWGQSGGGPHALACAALLPDLLVAAVVLSSPAPYQAEGLDWFAGMGEDNLAEFGAALRGRETLLEFLENAAPSLLNAEPTTLVGAMRSLLCPSDAAVLTEDAARHLIAHARAGIEHSREGWAEDDLAFLTAWGFELSQIRIPVMLMHGEQDQMVPFAHAKWLADRIPNVEARFLPNDGHLTILFRRIPEAHEWLAGKMD